jgi:hypothetical protein
MTDPHSTITYIFQANSPEQLRQEIVRFLRQRGELIHELRNLTHTKGEATGHEQTANDLLQAALDIERADLREAD